MADHAVTLTQRDGSGRSIDIVIRASERNGRWIGRPAHDGELAEPEEWPVVADGGATQRVWVGTSETEVVTTALNFLRTLYDVKQS